MQQRRENLKLLEEMHRAVEQSKAKEQYRLQLLSAASHRLGDSNILNIFNAEKNINDSVGEGDASSLSLIEKGMYEYISSDGSHAVYNQNGSYDRFSSRWIMEDLNDLKSMSDVDVISSDVINCAAKAYSKIIPFIDSNDNSGLASSLHEDYLNGLPIIIPTGCIGHSATITVLGNMLSITNKGLGKHPDSDKGTLMIKLDSPLSKENIENFLQYMDIDDGMLSANCLISKLAGKEIASPDVVINPGEILENLPNEIGSLPQKSQKYGTCGYTNKKSAVEAMIAMSKISKLLHPDEDLYGPHVFSEHHIDEYKAKLKTSSKSARNNYKKITAKIRDLEISRLIEELRKEFPHQDESPSNDLYVSNIIDKLICHVNLHHHKKGDAIIEDREIYRAKDIIEELESLGIPVLEKLTSETKEALDIDTKPDSIQVPDSITSHFLTEQPLVETPPQPAMLGQKANNWGKLVAHIKDKGEKYSKMLKEQQIENANIPKKTMLPSAGKQKRD